MPIVNVTVNENNRWKSERERKKNKKTERNKGVTQAIVKV